MIYNLIISPIEMLLDWIFNFFQKSFDLEPVWCLIAISLTVNILTLPLYNVAENLQKKERETEKKLEYRVKRIKKAFKGNEQFMMLNTYYRQNGYNPIYTLRSSLSILIEIPFFIAAYHFLSNCNSLMKGQFWIIESLGEPDALIHFSVFGSVVAINILPIIMTLINIISGLIYSSEYSTKERVQLYGIGVVFLILLYNSPSGLVLYWILNNIFSLCKNLVLKYCNFNHQEKDIDVNENTSNISKGYFHVFLIAAVGIAVLAGLLLPASALSSSALEFTNSNGIKNPLEYLPISLSCFAGLFVLWPIIIYKLFEQKIHKVLSALFCIIFPSVLLNVYVFKQNFGIVSSFFDISEDIRFRTLSVYQIILPLVALITWGILVIITLRQKWFNYLRVFFLVLVISELIVSVVKILDINSQYNSFVANKEKYSTAENSDRFEPMYHLSKNKTNVIIFFLDRSVGVFAGRIFQEYPDIGRQFEDFTYYKNTVSFSNCTVTGADPMLAGYEYTPEEMNERSDELLRDKHNEATLVMPKLFHDAGFDVKITDIPWPNYTYFGDLSPYDAYPEYNVEEMEGRYYENYINEFGLGESEMALDTII